MASFTPTKILIFGGTGVIGRYITTSILRAKPNFREVTLFTSPGADTSKAALLGGWKSQGMSVVEGDLGSATDVRAVYATGVDTVVSCVGRGALQHQVELLRLAEEAPSVKWFLPSEFGTDVEHNTKSPSEKPHQNKLKLRAYVRENVERVHVTYLVTGPYFDMWVNQIPEAETAGGFAVDKKQAYLIRTGTDQVGFCTMWDVGKSVVAALRHPEQSFGKALKVQSFVVTPNEVLAEFERQTGTKWSVTYTPLEALQELEAKLWEQGTPVATGVTLRRIWAEGGTLYQKNDNETIGLAAEKMDPLSLAVERVLAGGYKKERNF